MTATRRRPDRQLVAGHPGDYTVHADRNLDGTRGTGWHFDVMGPASFETGWRPTKLWALRAARRRARRNRTRP